MELTSARRGIRLHQPSLPSPPFFTQAPRSKQRHRLVRGRVRGEQRVINELHVCALGSVFSAQSREGSDFTDAAILLRRNRTGNSVNIHKASVHKGGWGGVHQHSYCLIPYFPIVHTGSP